MTVLYIIKTLLSDPIIQSYLIGCGSSASWDAIKLLGKKGDDTLENQLYGVLSETFERFAGCMNLEYDEQLVSYQTNISLFPPYPSKTRPVKFQLESRREGAGRDTNNLLHSGLVSAHPYKIHPKIAPQSRKITD